MGVTFIPLSDNMAELFKYQLEQQKDSISKNNSYDSLLHHAVRESEGGGRLWTDTTAFSAIVDACVSPLRMHSHACIL